MSRCMHAILSGFVLVAVLVGNLVIAPRPADAVLSAFDTQLLAYINNHRATLGLTPFVEHEAFSDASRAWSTQMKNDFTAAVPNASSQCLSAPGGTFRHDSLANINSQGVPPGHQANAGENIAFTCGYSGVRLDQQTPYCQPSTHSFSHTSTTIERLSG